MKAAYLKFLLLIGCFFIAFSGWAQVKKITGIVTDESNNPIAGVSIVVQGKTEGTQTIADGTFSIEAAPGEVLKFSFVGHNPQSINVGNSATIEVSMKAASANLDEVVVVGYGTQSRRNVTSAVSKLDQEVLSSAPRSNVATALQGTVSGLQVVNATGQPGASPVIMLRGGASINNPGGPLVVVDGVIRSMDDIASEDIESMQLLKDAAATAIYGARANNGVILITTKQGKSGKAEISYKFTGGFNQQRQDYQYLGAKDYIYYNRLGNLNSGRTLAQVNSSRGYGLLTDSANLSSFDIRAYTGNESLLSQGWDTLSDPYGPNAANPSGAIIFKDHGGEVKDIVFRNTFTQDHYISALGGNDKGKYFASFDYYNEPGTIVGSEYKRYSGNLNASYKVKPNVEISTGVTASTSSTTGVIGSEINTLYRTMALWPTFNPWLDDAKTKPNPGNGINDGNTLYWLDKRDISNEVNRIILDASVKWDLLPGLFVKATANAYLAENVNQSFTKATQTYNNIFSPTQPSYNSVARPAAALFSRDFQQQYNAIINYTKRVKDVHNFNVMLGTEYFGVNSLGMQVSGTNAPTDDISTVNASTLFAANTSTDPNNLNNNYSNQSQYRIISTFGRLNYDYDNRFLFTAVFRNDGVSSLAADNRYGFFPGMSAGWNLQNEKFFYNGAISKYISTLKPRVSYGQNGNVAGLGRYEVQGTYSLQGLYNGNAGFLNTGIINSNLQWEKSKTIDVGFDLGILNNRITVLFDYYDRKTSDLLTNLALPGYTGFSSLRTNLGTYQNTGYEFTVNANVLKQPNGLRLDVGATASFVKNKVLQLPYNGNEHNRQGGLQVYDPASGKVIWVGGLQEGQSLGAIYAYKQLSIFQDASEVAKIAGTRYDAVAQIGGPNLAPDPNIKGLITPGDVNWLDVDKNDTIDSRDQVYMGNIYPKWTGGFNFNLSYKGFSLYSRFEFALGHTIYNDLVARTLGNYQGSFNYLDLQKQSWSPTNTVTDIPKVYYADQVSAPLGKKNYTRSNNANSVLNSNNSHFYEKGDYLACREVTLSYQFPKNIITKSKVFSQARVYTSVNNWFYITNFSGPSPEPPVTPGTTSISGVYAGTYPTPINYVIGLQVTF